MKAFLLAAGLGTRLRPLTDTVPKCMLPVGGKPLLGIWLDALWEAGVSEVLVNVHHLADMVVDYVQERTGPPSVICAGEAHLAGTAGTLLRNRDWITGEEFFLVCNADGLTDFWLDDVISAHAAWKPAATIVTYQSRNPHASGILETDARGIMTRFEEKPSDPVSSLANAGIYAFSPAVLDEIAGRPPQDIGRDLLPRLTGRARTIPLPGYYRDIGTPEDYRLAQEEWAAL